MKGGERVRDIDKEKLNIETRLEVMNSTDTSVDIYLYGSIREPYWWDEEDEGICISSKQFKKALDKAKGKEVNLHINSGGGDVFESIAIANQLKQHDNKVHVVIDGLAGSGASVVAMAGDTIKMFESSMIMIHKAWTYASGNADELRKTADNLDKIDASVKASYMGRFVGTEEELEDLIADETWITADEAKVFGFTDEVDQDKEEEENEVENKVLNKETLFQKYFTKEQEVVASTKETLFDKFKGGK